jgi:hypothetical protein
MTGNEFFPNIRRKCALPEPEPSSVSDGAAAYCRRAVDSIQINDNGVSSGWYPVAAVSENSSAIAIT